MDLPKKVTVLVDTREKYPFLFPSTVTFYPYHAGHTSHVFKIKAQKSRMPEGDYTIENQSSKVLIERKGSFSELASNFFTKDWKRTTNAIARFATATENPYLLLEAPPTGFCTPSGTRIEPERVLDAFLACVIKWKLHLIWTGRITASSSRRNMGKILIHIMLQHIYGRSSPEYLHKNYGEFLDIGQNVG